MHIGVVGLGYVGQPLAAAFADAGFRVTGYDIDEQKIETLGREALVAAVTNVPEATHRSDPPTYTSDPTRLGDCDVIITSVPTPVTADRKPDLSIIRAAGRTIGEQLAPGTIVVLESTVNPGATREEFVPVLEEASGLVLGEDFDVGYSPERIDPGTDRSLQNTVKPVSAFTDDVRGTLADLYSNVAGDVYLAPSVESAEAAKCLENAQRDLNIAFINQFAMACHGIDWLEYEDVLGVAESKWNFQRYRPGLVEGHCIPVDPYYLIDTIERHGESASLMREARVVNESVADYILELVADAFDERREQGGTDGGDATTTGHRVLACGLAYKPNTADVRSTIKRRLFDGLREAGLEPVGYDPYVEPEAAAGAFGLECYSSIEESEASAALLLTDHDEFADFTTDGLAASLSEPPVVVDITGKLEEPTRSDIIFRRL